MEHAIHHCHDLYGSLYILYHSFDAIELLKSTDLRLIYWTSFTKLNSYTISLASLILMTAMAKAFMIDEICEEIDEVSQIINARAQASSSKADDTLKGKMIRNIVKKIHGLKDVKCKAAKKMYDAIVAAGLADEYANMLTIAVDAKLAGSGDESDTDNTGTKPIMQGFPTQNLPYAWNYFTKTDWVKLQDGTLSWHSKQSVVIERLKKLSIWSLSEASQRIIIGILLTSSFPDRYPTYHWIYAAIQDFKTVFRAAGTSGTWSVATFPEDPASLPKYTYNKLYTDEDPPVKMESDVLQTLLPLIPMRSTSKLLALPAGSGPFNHVSAHHAALQHASQHAEASQHARASQHAQSKKLLAICDATEHTNVNQKQKLFALTNNAHWRPSPSPSPPRDDSGMASSSKSSSSWARADSKSTMSESGDADSQDKRSVPQRLPFTNDGDVAAPHAAPTTSSPKSAVDYENEAFASLQAAAQASKKKSATNKNKCKVDAASDGKRKSTPTAVAKEDDAHDEPEYDESDVPVHKKPRCGPAMKRQSAKENPASHESMQEFVAIEEDDDETDEDESDVPVTKKPLAGPVMKRPSAKKVHDIMNDSKKNWTSRAYHKSFAEAQSKGASVDDCYKAARDGSKTAGDEWEDARK